MLPTLFTHDFLAELKHEPVTGCLKVCSTVFGRLSADDAAWTETDHRFLCEAYAVVSALVDGGLLPLRLDSPAVRGRTADDCSALRQYLDQAARLCRELQSRQRLDQLKLNVRWSMGLGVQYALGATELKRLKELAHQMDHTLATGDALPDGLAHRLRGRLARLLANLRPAMPEGDRFWGLIGDARVIRASGNTEARQLAGWLTEMSDIVWHVQARAEGLPTVGHAPAVDFMQAPQPPAAPPEPVRVLA
jgi:hypothetical protein